jgi:predicted phosphohydrolase
MIKIPSDTTVLTNENYEVLIAILEEMRGCLSNDLEMEELSDRAGDVLSRDYRRLRTIQQQLALTMETFKL